MPVELPDINILIALLDVRHQHHETAEAWFATTKSVQWATCGLTQSSCVRIISNPNYPGLNYNVAQSIDALELLIAHHADTHAFWPETVSICDRALFDRQLIAGPKQISDIYLLGLCQERGATLVTLDSKISTSAIRSPHPQLLRIL